MESTVDKMMDFSYWNMKGITFHIQMNPNLYKRGDLISCDRDNKHHMKVLKVLKMTWWKKLLSFLHIEQTWIIGYKVKQIS